MYSITESVVSRLSNPSRFGSFSNSDFTYEWVVGEEAFLSAASDRYPEGRGLLPLQKEQIDISGDVGENLFSSWWTRSQRDWSGGAGRDYLEPADDETVMKRFKTSMHVNVWDDGKISLLPYVQDSLEYNLTGNVATPVRNTATGQKIIYFLGHSTQSYTSVETGAWDGGDESIPFDPIDDFSILPVTAGKYLYAGDDSTDTIKRYSLYNTTWSYVTLYTNVPAQSWGGSGSTDTIPPRLFFIKDRLMLALQNDLYQLSPNASSVDFTTETPEYTHVDPDWIWSSVAEAPTAILASGFNGDASYIYSFGVTDSGGAQTLSQGVVVAEMPPGERIMTMKTFLGVYLVLGTTEGVRIGVITPEGSLAYGPLSYDESACDSLYMIGRFLYAGVRDVYPHLNDHARPGLIRFDLSAADENGFYPWAPDMVHIRWWYDGEAVTSIADIDGRLCYTTGQPLDATKYRGWYSSGAVFQTSELMPEGYLDTAQIRFSTLEDKSFQKLKVLQDSARPGVVEACVVNSEGEVSSFATYSSDTVTLRDVNLAPQLSGTSMGLRLKLYRDSTDTTDGPIVTGYMVKALPRVRRKQVWQVPLLCFDVERDRFGVTRGTPGSAALRLQDLREVLINGDPVLFRNLITGDSIIGVVDNMEFQQTSPPAGSSGFGGIVQLSIREV